MTVMLPDCISCLSPSPPAARRVHAGDLRVGDVVLVDGEPRTVVGRARALDSTIDFQLDHGGAINWHPMRRVSLVG